MNADVRVDWARLALDLRQAGLPLQKASARIGQNLGFVAQLARGEVQEPKFSQGVALLDLHFDVCGADRTRSLLMAKPSGRQAP